MIGNGDRYIYNYILIIYIYIHIHTYIYVLYRAQIATWLDWCSSFKGIQADDPNMARSFQGSKSPTWCHGWFDQQVRDRSGILRSRRWTLQIYAGTYRVDEKYPRFCFCETCFISSFCLNKQWTLLQNKQLGTTLFMGTSTKRKWMHNSEPKSMWSIG